MTFMLPSPTKPDSNWLCVHPWSPEKGRALDLAFSAVSCICSEQVACMLLNTQISFMTQDNFLSHSDGTVSESKGYKVNCQKIQIIKNISS